MARLEYIEPSPDDAELQALVQKIKGERGGRLVNLYKVLLNSPPVAAGWLQFGTAVRYEAKLDGRSRELAICQIARLTRAEYEWRAHSRLALQEGIRQNQLEVLPDWRLGHHFDDRERAVLAYTEAMTVLIDVDEPTFADLRRHFDPQEIMELTATVGFYNMVSRVLVALEVDLD